MTALDAQELLKPFMPEFREITLRVAANTDSRLLMSWRNDIETRRNSKKMRKVTQLEHRAWLCKTLNDPLTKLFIILVDGKAAGTVRAVHDSETWLLSWTVSPELRGQNIGYEAVAKLIPQLHGIIRAEVKIDNHPSIRIVEKLGMECIEVKEKITAWILRR